MSLLLKLFKKTSFLSLLITALILMAGCSAKSEAPNEVIVGTISGPETQLMETAKDIAAKKFNLKVKIIEFSDYTMPNTALSEGSLDANMFQHQPYLDEVLRNKNYPITALAKTFLYPMGIYSQKVKNLNDLPVAAVVAIPNDPSNEARALLLLNKAGLITLKPGVTTTATPLDITANPKKLQFKELDAAQLPRVLPDVSLAVINTNYAIPAGLYPNRDAIFMEDKNSPYANLLVVRTADVNKPKLQQLVIAIHSPEVLQQAQKLFNNQAIPAWKN